MVAKFPDVAWFAADVDLILLIVKVIFLGLLLGTGTATAGSRLCLRQAVDIESELADVEALHLIGNGLQFDLIPGHVDLGGQVVKHGHFAAFLAVQADVGALNGDELITGGLDDADFLDAGGDGALGGFVSGDEPVVFVEQDAASGSVILE